MSHFTLCGCFVEAVIKIIGVSVQISGFLQADMKSVKTMPVFKIIHLFVSIAFIKYIVSSDDDLTESIQREVAVQKNSENSGLAIVG